MTKKRPGNQYMARSFVYLLSPWGLGGAITKLSSTTAKTNIAL